MNPANHSHKEDGSTPAKQQGEREEAIRTSVLSALGRPARLYRVAVMPLWGDHFRVNVITGEDPASVKIPNSYFVEADGQGSIVECSPEIRKQY
jgi:hypothetical protein